MSNSESISLKFGKNRFSWTKFDKMCYDMAKKSNFKKLFQQEQVACQINQQSFLIVSS